MDGGAAANTAHGIMCSGSAQPALVTVKSSAVQCCKVDQTARQYSTNGPSSPTDSVNKTVLPESMTVAVICTEQWILHTCVAGPGILT